MATEYKIFRDPSVGVIDQYAPAASVKKQVRDIFIRNAAENDKVISKETADMIVKGNIVPATDASYTLGTARKRYSRVYLASTIDVSGSMAEIRGWNTAWPEDGNSFFFRNRGKM